MEKCQNRHCFVPGCLTGYKSQRQEFKENGKRMPSLFGLKKGDYETLQLWKKVIPTANREFTFGTKICELHFKKSDIISHFVHTFPDGTTQEIERERYVLKPGAVPTFFPSVPYYWFKRKYSKRKGSKCAAVPQKKESKGIMEDTEIPKKVIKNTKEKDDTHEIYFSTSNGLEVHKESENFSVKTYSKPKRNRSRTVTSKQGFISTVDVEDHFLNNNNLDNLSENNMHTIKEESMETNSSVSEHVKCVTPAEAFSAAETLLHFLINQDDVSTADIDSILNITKKIQRLSLENANAQDNS